MPPGLTVEDSPIEMLLKEQATLQTPVGVFSAQHDLADSEPEQAQFYKQLLPLSKPGEGEQYAFKVELDKCTGCKACVSACHSLNGLDPHETWRDVGTIHGFDQDAAYAQTVTTACHHCADPGCLNGCPVLAYEKDEATGIVHHLDDQCIGCQYCVLKCPYDVPKYSDEMGIVRKCDMCHSRLADGEAPACVQACPTEAISITIVDTSEIIDTSKRNAGFLPTAPEPQYTQPTTQYVTERTIPENVAAADQGALKPEHAHLPLVFMLVLTQLSVGLYMASLFFEAGGTQIALSLLAFLAMGAGLAASTSHLGRPLGAWRAFLGLRRSWLSREIVVFGVYSLVAPVYTFGQFFGFVPSMLLDVSGLLTVGLGLLGVYCSAMIYHDTQRPFWHFSISGAKFFATCFVLGLVTAAAVQVILIKELSPMFLYLSMPLLGLKLLMEMNHLEAAGDAAYSPAKKTAQLMLKPLKLITMLRFAFGTGGFLALVIAFFAPIFIVLAAALLLAGELLERTLYFKAVAAPKMPGGVYA